LATPFIHSERQNLKICSENVIKLSLYCVMCDWSKEVQSTVCPTRYRIRHFFDNSNTDEDIATKFEQEYVRCVRNEKECVCSVCL